MTQLHPGDTVRVLAPFDAVFPDQYQVEGVDEAGSALIAGGRSFDDSFLELVAAGQGETVSVGPRLVSPGAFLRRFTDAERVAIDLASIDTPGADISVRAQSAQLRIYQQDVQTIKTGVDLNLPRTRAGVQTLEAVGLIGAGRALQIIDAPIQSDEEP